MAIDLTLESNVLTHTARVNSTLTKPTNTVDGDFLLAAFRFEDNIAVTPPAGWNLIVNVDDPSSADDLYVYYKRASSEPADWTWTHNNVFCSSFVKRFTGVVASGDPEDATRSTDSGTSAQVSSSSITTATANSAIVQISCNTGNVGRTASTLTSRIATCPMLMADVQASAGASGAKTIDIDSSQNWIVTMIALKEATSGGGLEEEFSWFTVIQQA